MKPTRTPTLKPTRRWRKTPALREIQASIEGRGDGESVLSGELSEEEQKIVDELKKTDQKVRAHEQAHKSAAGPYAGPISYETVTGPDGQQYAVGGEVAIDTSPIPDNPQATIQKADIILRAALAPADPSPQDYAVARAAQQLRAQAQKELQEQREAEKAENESDTSDLNDIAGFDPNAPTNAQEQQISQLIQSLNQTEALLLPSRGSNINAIN